jgi:predicted acylesterase/phospholipase RssA
MKVIDAVCMSMAVPLIFACGKYDGKTYVDGGTQEQYPITPFLDKKPHEVTCMKIKMDRIYQESIETPKQYVECLVRSLHFLFLVRQTWRLTNRGFNKEGYPPKPFSEKLSG